MGQMKGEAVSGVYGQEGACTEELETQMSAFDIGKYSKKKRL